ncbi:mycofactocin biosynthesis glycosyltransferase MftF [Tomitella fengzijianii]|uniref:Mycofactocin system glycosyltransferase n=1 Tax=Tomitella fengzijianii TaxID=2597660 RepID=A0A516X1L8_9ACTN|nr:mycofactocin biosynthesis glycosyltransferase MftF [Tomitella fengzijianii]QDQ96943.1 mycofactocin system glycosyltransferase [Tomitella fengzijianii]
MSDGLPIGFRVRVGASVRVLDGGTALIGGAPTRLLRLKPRAAELLASGELTVVDAVTGALARRLLDAGIAHPALSPADIGLSAEPLHEVTVVIPVHDNQPGIDRLLRALVGVPVIVVDDGSPAPVHAPGARIIRHDAPRGPAAARNAGLAACDTALVAFLDSDTVPRPGWLDALSAHFTDPSVALAAPRITALDAADEPENAWPGAGLTRYEEIRSSLDLGAAPGPVVPGTPVSYVPSAAMVVRRTAITGIATEVSAGGGFDERMHVAEDVDLCWRLHEAGWRLRYDPDAEVTHEHRTRLRGWLGRKAYYGLGAAPLAERHPGEVAPLILAPWSAVAGAAVFTGTRAGAGVAAVVSAGAGVRIARTLSGLRHPGGTAARLLALGLVSALWQLALGVCRHYWPLAVIAAVVSPRARRVVVATAVAEGLVDWCERDLRGGNGRWRRPRLDPLRYVVCKRLDDAGYGAGLWLGAIRARSVAALLPRRG